MNPQVAEYLRKKLAEEEKLAQITAESKAADAEANRQNRFAESLSRAAASFGSIGGRGPTSQLDLGQADSSADVLAQQAKVKGAESQYQLAQNLAKDEENDPESGSSKAARAMVSQYMPSFSKDPSFAMMSASQIKTMMPFMKEALESQRGQKETWSSTGKTDDSGNLILISNLGNQRTGPKVSEAQNTKATVVDSQAKEFSGKAAELQDLSRSLGNLEQAIGFPLEKAIVDTDKVIVGGKSQDLPGVNLPLVGRVSALSSDARGIQSMFDRLMNVTLKERSGAAVTANELDRLKSEYEAGKFNTEADMIRGLKRLKQAMAEDFQNLRAGYRPEAIAEYERRGGQTGMKQPYIKDPGEKYKVDDGAAYAAPESNPFGKSKEQMSEAELEQYIKYLKGQ